MCPGNSLFTGRPHVCTLASTEDAPADACRWCCCKECAARHMLLMLLLLLLLSAEDTPAAGAGAEGATLESILSDGFITDLIGVTPGAPNSAPGSGVTSPRTSVGGGGGGGAAGVGGPLASSSRLMGAAAAPGSSPGGYAPAAGVTGGSAYSNMGASAGPTGGSSYFGSPGGGAAAGPTGPPTPEPGAPLVPGRPAPVVNSQVTGVTPQVTGGVPPAPGSAAEAFGITGQGAAPASQLPTQGECGWRLLGVEQLSGHSLYC
jgi:hypothetical protein